MAAQDYGDLSDYQVNGDNYTKLQPDGSTLVIPSVYGHQPIAPQATKDTYRDLAQCSGNIAALIAHDATTGFYYILETATFDPNAYEGCSAALCALAGLLNCGDCRGLVQAHVDSLAGAVAFGNPNSPV